MKTVKHHKDDEEQFEIIKGFSEILQPFNTLEVGCGYSRFKALFKNYVGMDVDPEKDADFVGDVRNIYFFEENTFEFVFSCTCLMHIKDVTQAIKEMERVSSDYVLLIETKKKLKRAYNHDYESLFTFIKLLELKLTTPRSPLHMWLFKK